MAAGSANASRWLGPLAAVGAVLVAACPARDLLTAQAPSEAPTLALGPTQKVAATVAPTTAPAAASPTASPSTSPTPRVLQVDLVPQTATLGVKPRTGATAVRASTLQFAPQIVLETGATYSAVVWSSSNTVVATVDGKGLVSAGTATGSAIVKLQIGTLECTASVSVVDLGGAGVTIQ